MPEVIGFYIAIIGAFFALYTSIPVKKMVDKGRISERRDKVDPKFIICDIYSPNKSELEIKFNGKESQQFHFSIVRHGMYKQPGLTRLDLNQIIAANSVYIHKLEYDCVYELRIDADDYDLCINDLDIQYKQFEYHHRSERLFQIALTIISVGFIIYYSK